MERDSPILVAVEDAGDDRVYVCGCADEKNYAKQEALEVEEGRLY